MFSITLRVTAIRSQNPRGFGGCIFAGIAIDADGRVTDAASYYVVRGSSQTLGGALVQSGQWWTVAGEVAKRQIEVNGYCVAECQVEAITAYLVRPSGLHIVGFLADNPSFKGIGRVKAQKLWDELGEKIYSLLDSGDTASLATLLTPTSAAQLIDAWSQNGDSQTLQWLQVKGLEFSVGQRVLKFYGADTIHKLEADPYRLLSFCGSWEEVDALALTHFGIEVHDLRRLQGALEEACYRVFGAGHTAVSVPTLSRYLRRILGSPTATFQWSDLIAALLSEQETNGSYVFGRDGRDVQAIGPYVMEHHVANAVVSRLKVVKRHDDLLCLETETKLYEYEVIEGIKLNREQREAVHLAVENRFALITGGPGVGKTTVLKALYHVLDGIGITVIQLAVAGRAAKRMQETTGRNAWTIARFLHTSETTVFDKRCLIVVDEASMVDIITMSSLCEKIGNAPRLLLIGDPEQLMPIGPGLVLHALFPIVCIPQVRLTEVKRYGQEINAAAAAIRDGQWPNVGCDPAAAIAFLSRSSFAYDGENSISQTVVDLYCQDPENTQILCSRRSGPAGSIWLNEACQNAISAHGEAITVLSEHSGGYEYTGFRNGDSILCVRNMWERGLQNGSLGRIVQVDQLPRVEATEVCDSLGLTIAWAKWDDGISRPIVEEMLDDLELGYAITVHKAQGSQWPRVIVPLTGHRLLDRTLIYTAVTRAQKQVLLVGDLCAARAAVEGIPKARLRVVKLHTHIKEVLSNCNSDV